MIRGPSKPTFEVGEEAHLVAVSDTRLEGWDVAISGGARRRLGGASTSEFERIHWDVRVVFAHRVNGRLLVGVAGVRQGIQPHSPAVRDEVELIEQSRLIPIW